MGTNQENLQEAVANLVESVANLTNASDAKHAADADVAAALQKQADAVGAHKAAQLQVDADLATLVQVAKNFSDDDLES